MPTSLENLIQIRTNIEGLLLEATASPKPSYDLDGQQFDWTEYVDMLFRQLEILDDRISRMSSPRALWLGTERTP